MSIAARAEPIGGSGQMRSHIGRHTDKSFDWDAFPGSRGFPELERAQMRYIGAGGSPKADDPSTLKPGRFTLSLVHQPVGKYAACHSHEVVEHFLVLEGVLTVGWAWGDEVIEARLGPKDMVLNKAGRPHGFRNDGVEPVLMSISVGTGMPKPPVYVCHPRDSDPEAARRFGAPPGKTLVFDPDSDDQRQQEFARHIVRYVERRPVCGRRIRPIGLCGRGRGSTRPVSDGHGPSAEGRRGTRLFAPGRGRVSGLGGLHHGRLAGVRAYGRRAPRPEGRDLQPGRPDALFSERWRH